MDAIDERIALNETLFRDVNENIRKGASDGRHQDAHFVCECGESGCEERVPITLDAYRAVRDHRLHFLVKPGHEIPRAETVVERHSRYVVVEKPPETEPVLEEGSTQ